MSDPVSPQNAPYVTEETAGRKAWCACGQSQKQPYCDGSHRGSGISPVVVEIGEPCRVAWCGCKKTSTPPYCDGSHNKG